MCKRTAQGELRQMRSAVMDFAGDVVWTPKGDQGEGRMKIIAPGTKWSQAGGRLRGILRNPLPGSDAVTPRSPSRGASFGNWPQDEADLLQFFNRMLDVTVGEVVGEHE